MGTVVAVLGLLVIGLGIALLTGTGIILLVVGYIMHRRAGSSRGRAAGFAISLVGMPLAWLPVEVALAIGLTVGFGQLQIYWERGPLLAAVEDGDVQEVRRLLEGGTPPQTAEDGPAKWDAPLCRAGQLGQLDIMKALLEHGAKLEEVGPQKRSILLCILDPHPQRSVPEGTSRAEAVSLLLSHGARLDARRTHRDRRPLNAAVVLADVHLAEVLLGAGLPPDGRPGDGDPPLFAVIGSEPHPAEYWDRVEATFQVFLDAGADVNAPDRAGRTLLDRAERAGLERLAGWLRDHGGRRSGPGPSPGRAETTPTDG